MKILVACEESQAVTEAFRDRGHDAFSCDIEPSTGNLPQYHLQCDVSEILHENWDMVIAFPPCTHLSNAGACWWPEKRVDGRMTEGIDFFMRFSYLDVPFAIENPVGLMSTLWRKPDQIIQPWQFGDRFSKRTCLWLNGLPKLKSVNIVDRGEIGYCKKGKPFAKWYSDLGRLPPKERARRRSKTFPGIAAAMASQWG